MKFMNINENETSKITQVLFGRKIVAVDIQTGKLTLDNGTVLEIIPNVGCGGCENGNYELEQLSVFNNRIMRAEVVVDERDCDDTFELFVFSEDKSMSVVAVTGTDNGYYGRGFTIHVIIP